MQTCSEFAKTDPQVGHGIIIRIGALAVSSATVASRTTAHPTRVSSDFEPGSTVTSDLHFMRQLAQQLQTCSGDLMQELGIPGSWPRGSNPTTRCASTVSCACCHSRAAAES